jgi:hypothetical protein
VQPRGACLAEHNPHCFRTWRRYEDPHDGSPEPTWKSLLLLACELRCVDIALHLVQSGADVNCLSGAGQTPPILAAAQGKRYNRQPELIQALLGAGAMGDQPDLAGLTAIAAVPAGSEDILEQLMGPPVESPPPPPPPPGQQHGAASGGGLGGASSRELELRHKLMQSRQQQQQQPGQQPGHGQLPPPPHDDSDGEGVDDSAAWAAHMSGGGDVDLPPPPPPPPPHDDGDGDGVDDSAAWAAHISGGGGVDPAPPPTEPEPEPEPPPGLDEGAAWSAHISGAGGSAAPAPATDAAAAGGPQAVGARLIEELLGTAVQCVGRRDVDGLATLLRACCAVLCRAVPPCWIHTPQMIESSQHGARCRARIGATYLSSPGEHLSVDRRVLTHAPTCRAHQARRATAVTRDTRRQLRCSPSAARSMWMAGPCCEPGVSILESAHID